MRKTLLGAGVLGMMLAGLAAPASGKEYNKRQGIDPDIDSVLQRTLAKSRAPQVLDEDDALVITDDVVNTGCGKLEIAPLDPARGQRVDRDIIITGNVINSARNCPRR